ncbi:unnamed protein product [Agarophyton chilense]
MHVYWMHRDCRLDDNPALVAAAASSAQTPLCILYIYDDAILSSETFHQSHLKFINEGLQCMNARLAQKRAHITFRTGNALHAFQQIHASNPITAIFVNAVIPDQQERITRDVVTTWAVHAGIRWNESQLPGIVAGGRPTAGWAKLWLNTMRQLPAVLPNHINVVSSAQLAPDTLRAAHQLPCLKHTGVRAEAQTGGEITAKAVLNDFLHRRAPAYSSGLSSPVTAWEACSRLSPYLAWGHLSLRTVYQALDNKQTVIRNQRKARRESGPNDSWLKSLSAFGARLRWRSHFCQKLFDDPQMQTRNVCRAYDGLRESEWHQERFEAWINGRTGFPMVDACMRALHQSGWINFRMRAMLVSFASYTLWLDWKKLSCPLARLFLDYEPGIHYPQLQMQSGTTGMNALRIYNATKQLLDHDPEGKFVRRYVPELRDVPNQYLANPSSMPSKLQHACGCRIGKDYPFPIVDASEAYKKARMRFREVRSKDTTKEEAAKVYAKHGSRKGKGADPKNKRGREGDTSLDVETPKEKKVRRTIRARQRCECSSTEHEGGIRCLKMMLRSQTRSINTVTDSS